VNATADAQLTSLPQDKEALEKKLFNFAADSDIGRSGFLDLPARHLSGMPSDLTHIRRVRTGRHRVFYTGNFNQCSFNVFYIKKFKRTGVEDENDTRFHRILRGVVDESPVRTINKAEAGNPQD
jgi:hypothetical protein